MLPIDYKKKILPILVVFILLSCFSACKKRYDGGEVGVGSVTIRLKGAQYSKNDLNLNNGKKASVSKDSLLDWQEQQTILQLNNGLSIEATLTPLIDKPEVDLIQRKNKLAAPSVENKVLDNGVMYRVVVYNPDGTYKSEHDFTYGVGDASITGLDDEVTYTFVVYSVNSTDNNDLPDVNPLQNLSNATITVLNNIEYLMYYKAQLTLDYELPNYLDIVLEHKFSQITTTVSIDDLAFANGARIKSIDAPVITPERQSATIKLSDNSLSYGVPTLGKVLSGDVISSGGVKSYSFDPVNIISDDVSNAVMNFPSLTISTGSTVGAFIDMKNENFDISNLKITPGYRYNLNLNIVMPCVEKVEPSMLYNFTFPDSYGNINTSPSIEFESSDYGVEFNIYRLDQSFQLLINNQPIFIREAEFDYYGYDPDAPGGDGEDMDDVRFLLDNGRYWDNTYFTPIYDLVGDPVSNNPIVKVVIDVNGNVSMFGSRVSYGETVIWEGESYVYGLEPMYLTNGNGFNQVTWSNVSTNQVVLRQTSYGPTNILFNVIGYKKVACQ